MDCNMILDILISICTQILLCVNFYNRRSKCTPEIEGNSTDKKKMLLAHMPKLLSPYHTLPYINNKPQCQLKVHMSKSLSEALFVIEVNLPLPNVMPTNQNASPVFKKTAKVHMYEEKPQTIFATQAFFLKRIIATNATYLFLEVTPPPFIGGVIFLYRPL